MSSGHQELAPRVAVVVLGDVGRSPRMQYQALALADHLADVDLVGYGDSALPPALAMHARLHVHRLPTSGAPPRRPRIAFICTAAWRALRQTGQLMWMLLWVLPRPDVVLVQNPPAIPALLVARIAAWLRSAQLVIDWHNFGYAVLALTVGSRHPLVRLAAWYEGTVGRRADAHLCVARALQAELATRWGIRATVLYDRPAAQFVAPAAGTRQDILHRFYRTAELGADGSRPAVIVSATSWTADEDFALLLDAVVRCDARIRDHDQGADGGCFPHLVVVITGEGTLRAPFEAAIRRLTLRKIHLQTAWLSAEDYPRLLGAADLGLCVHRSASGVDLPMKIADMLGAGLPVCALDYGVCLRERFRPGMDGVLFSTAAELAEQLYELFRGFPARTPRLDQLRRTVRERPDVRWADEWMATAAPLFRRLLARRGQAPSGRT